MNLGVKAVTDQQAAVQQTMVLQAMVQQAAALHGSSVELL